MDISTLATTPQTSTQSSAFSQLTNNFDTFLTLLTTQLQNQDPLDPLDTENFTEQLVQFASVEQSIQTNTHLQALIDLQSASDRESAVGFIGKEITTNSDILNGNQGSWVVDLRSDAATASYSIVDATGETVATIDGPTTQGSHLIQWNGLDISGNRAPTGAYRLAINATANNGTAVTANAFVRAIVEGTFFSEDGPVLETNSGHVALDDIQRVAASQI